MVDGVPACVVAEFYPDEDPFSSPALERWLTGVGGGSDVVVCKHFVRSDYYETTRPDFKKSGCFFGGLCVRPKSQGFDGCCVDCPRWK